MGGCFLGGDMMCIEHLASERSVPFYLAEYSVLWCLEEIKWATYVHLEKGHQ